MGHKEPSRPHSKGPKRDLTQICFASPDQADATNGDATAPNYLKFAPNGKLVNQIKLRMKVIEHQTPSDTNGDATACTKSSQVCTRWQISEAMVI